MKAPNGCMCALGVLGHVIDPNAWIELDLNQVVGTRHRFHWKGENTLIAKEAEIDDVDARYLINMNDTHKKSFKEIADFVEEYL